MFSLFTKISASNWTCPFYTESIFSNNVLIYPVFKFLKQCLNSTFKKARKSKDMRCGICHNGLKYYLHSQCPKLNNQLLCIILLYMMNSKGCQRKLMLKDGDVFLMSVNIKVSVKSRLQMPPNAWQIKQRLEHLQN